MHIGIDLRLHAYAPGGVSRYARRLAMELHGMLAPEELTLIPHRREKNIPAAPGTRVYRAWTPPHNRWERWTLGLELLPQRLDLLHCTDFIPPNWGAKKTVITVHDLNFLYYPQYLTVEARRYYNGQIAWAVTRADAILADSYATQQDLIEKLHVPAQKINVVHLAADECFRPCAPEDGYPTLERYGLEPGYILFVGTWEPRKNLPGLLEALAKLHARGEKRTLVIAGRPGWLYDEIFGKIKQLGLKPWVRFIKSPTIKELLALFNSALLLTMPSFYEGFGLPALEALQCGTPAVVANRASLPEVVGDAALLADPDDPESFAEAYWRIARDLTLRQRLRTQGLEQAKNFTWEQTARKTLSVYQNVLKKR